MDPSVEQSEGSLGAADRSCGESQCLSHSILAPTWRTTPDPLVALILSGAETQPGGEVLLGGEAADVAPDISEDHQCRGDVDSSVFDRPAPSRVRWVC